MTPTHRIMLVEDESIIAMDVQQRLERLGYQVVALAASGADAIRTAFEVVPDMILMDVKIRGPLDGIETATRIRASRDIPVIYVTAFADENTIKRASLTEAFGYLLKPFEDRELQSVIETALYKQGSKKDCVRVRSDMPWPPRRPTKASGTGTSTPTRSSTPHAGNRCWVWTIVCA
jgi:CheY-like chemotaxis protein